MRVCSHTLGSASWNAAGGCRQVPVVVSSIACAARKQRAARNKKQQRKDNKQRDIEAVSTGTTLPNGRTVPADTAGKSQVTSDTSGAANGASPAQASVSEATGSASSNGSSPSANVPRSSVTASSASNSASQAGNVDNSTGSNGSRTAVAAEAAGAASASAAAEGPTSSATSTSNESSSGFVPLKRPEQAQRKYEERMRSQQAAGTSSKSEAAGATDGSGSSSSSAAERFQPAVTMSRPKSKNQSTITAISRDKGDDGSLLPQQLLQKVGLLVALVAASRVGVYARLPGIDIDRYSDAVARSNILGWVDSITGGSLSNVGVFTLGIIPAINASIFLQLLTISFPGLKKLQREEGPSGRARFQLYQKLATLAFAAAQSFGQLSTLKNYATDPSPQWFLSNSFALVAGAMIVNQLADYITELKLGNGTSVLIFASIASFLPTSVGSAFQQAGQTGSSGIAIYFIAFLMTTFGVVVAQTAERRVPINTASRYNVGSLTRQNYFPFKVNGTGVMPVIFASSVIGVPPFLAKIAGADSNNAIVQQLQPTGSLYLPLLVTLIVVINYFYTFIQFEPNDIAENLKKGQSSIPGVRPGKNTAQYITDRLTNMAVLGSIFLGLLSCAPVVTEKLTGVSALRGFAGTSVLIVVGVATELARRIRAEKQMSKYGNIDDLYDKL